MYWYDFGRLDVYVGKGGEYDDDDTKTISLEEKEKIAKLFDEHLLKIYYTDESSYDNSDDDRVGDDSYHSSSSYVYRSVNLEQDLYGVVMHDGEIVGIAFYVNENRYDTFVNVFYFSNQPKNAMTLGYSASHSSSYTTVFKVELVKKGENDVPQDAKELSFIQSRMYPEI